MITFRWVRGGTFIVLKDKKEIGILNPVTKKKSCVSFNSDFKDDREEEKKKIIDVFFEDMPVATVS